MKPNKKYLSFYYEDITEVPDFYIDPKKTALLIVDMQKHFLLKDGEDAEEHKKSGTWEKWKPYFDHVEKVTIPNNKRLIDACRKHGIEVTYGRICSLKSDGTDRARVQSTFGWNNILVPINTPNADANPDLAIAPASSELGEAQPYCIAVAKGDPKGLLPGINEAIAKMQSEDKLAEFIAAANELSGVAVEVTPDTPAA